MYIYVLNSIYSYFFILLIHIYVLNILTQTSNQIDTFQFIYCNKTEQNIIVILFFFFFCYIGIIIGNYVL